MKRISRIMALFGIMMALTGCVAQTQPATEETESKQIVSTSVAICEILDALGVDSVVGIPETSSELPERYENIATIGSPMSPDLELIRSVDPTIILSPVSLKADLEVKYEALNVESYFVDLTSVESMYESIEALGDMFGKEEEAKQLVAEYEEYIAGIQSIMEDGSEKTVLILMGLPGSYVVATEHSYAGSILKLVGAVNVYEGESTEEFISVNTEDMLSRDPDIILRTSHALPDQVMAMFETEFAENDIWKHFDAVKEGKVYDLSSHNFGMSANFNYKEAIEEVIPYLQ